MVSLTRSHCWCWFTGDTCCYAQHAGRVAYTKITPPHHLESSCRAQCEANSFCVTQLTEASAPNAGCLTCGGECWIGADNCNASSTLCYDARDTVPAEKECVCLAGYEDPVQSTGTCTDIDECAVGGGGGGVCTPPAFCVNTAGSFECGCPAGYVLSGSNPTVCVDVDECGAGNPCGGTGSTCTNTVGSYTCTCSAGNFVYGLVSQCRPCGAGHYVVGGTACVACSAGRVNNVTNAAGCTVCPANTVANTPQSGCDCDTGFVLEDFACMADCALGQKRVAGTVCLPCGLGFYGTAPGVCASCPTNKITLHDNATSAADCVCQPGTVPLGNSTSDGCQIECGPGLRVDPNAGVCVACPFGSYSNTTSTDTVCTPCPYAGMITGGSGAVSVSQCSCLPGLAGDIVDSVPVCATVCLPGQARPDPDEPCEVSLCEPLRLRAYVIVL